MSALATFVQQIRSQFESPRFRHLPKLLALAAVVVFVATLSWLPGARDRLAQRETELAEALKMIQSDIAEYERLKGRALPPKLAGAPLKEAVLASMATQRPPLAVELADAARIRVHGSGNFDSVVRWLGDVQQSHRLGIKSMAVDRKDAGTTVDITLSASRE